MHATHTPRGCIMVMVTMNRSDQRKTEAYSKDYFIKRSKFFRWIMMCLPYASGSHSLEPKLSGFQCPANLGTHCRGQQFRGQGPNRRKNSLGCQQHQGVCDFGDRNTSPEALSLFLAHAHKARVISSLFSASHLPTKKQSWSALASQQTLT